MPAEVIDQYQANRHEEPSFDRPAIGRMLDEVDNLRRVQKPYMRDLAQEHEGALVEGQRGVSEKKEEQSRAVGESPESRSYSDELRDFVRSWTDEPLFRLAYYIAIFSLSMQHGHKGLSWHDYEFYPQRDQPGLAQEKVKQESHKEKDGWF